MLPSAVRTFTLLFALALPVEGSAEAIFLSCSGTSGWKGQSGQPEGKDNISVAVDMAKKALMIGSDTWPIRDITDNLIVAGKPGVVLVELSRQSGVLHASSHDQASGATIYFTAVCRPDRKLP